MRRAVFENSNVNDLLRQPELLHVGLVVPEQPFVIHDARVSPVSDCRHHHVDFLSSRCNALATADWHGLGERTSHVTDHRGPMPVRDFDWVLLDRKVGHRNEHSFQVLDVLFDAMRVVTVRPGYGDVCGMALLQAIPFLIAEHIEVERVEFVQMQRNIFRRVG